jgi:hypothetical protein
LASYSRNKQGRPPVCSRHEKIRCGGVSAVLKTAVGDNASDLVSRVDTKEDVGERFHSQLNGGFLAKMLLSGGPQRSTRAELPVSPEVSPKEICQTVFVTVPVQFQRSRLLPTSDRTASRSESQGTKAMVKTLEA